VLAIPGPAARLVPLVASALTGLAIGFIVCGLSQRHARSSAWRG
jgi:hypothetical protein